MASPLHPHVVSLRKACRFLLLSSLLFAALGPPVGLWSSSFVRVILTDGIGVIGMQDLMLMVTWLPLAYYFGGIPAVSTGIVYGFLNLLLPQKLSRMLLWRTMLGAVIGAVATRIFFTGYGMDIVLWAGLPAGGICGLLARNRPPNTPTAESGSV